MSGAGDPHSSRDLVEYHDHLPAIPPPPNPQGQRGDGNGTGGGHGGGHGGGDGPRKTEPAPSPRKALWVLIPLALLLAWGVWHHMARSHRAAQAQQANAHFEPTIRTIDAKREDQPVDLVLPGQSVAFYQASLYARATGYVAERHVDIGTRVKKNDLLLRIAAPDLDQQLAQASAQLGQAQAQLLQAEATLEQAQANTKLANVTKFRTTTLATQGWETRQNADQSIANAAVQASNVDAAQAGVRVAEANFKAQLATVQRLQALTGFERVLAPFDGVVTQRSIEVGDLVTGDAGGGTALFAVQDDNLLRIAVQVPQSAAIGLRDGQDADITVPEIPGKHFHGTVSRSSVALLPASRSLQAEVDVPNADHVLRPGLYVNVTFHIPRQQAAVMLPSDALVFNGDGMQVAVIDAQNKVRFHKVTIGRDFGQQVELSDGLQGGERVALGLPAGVDEGGTVKIQPPDQDKKGQDQSGSKAKSD